MLVPSRAVVGLGAITMAWGSCVFRRTDAVKASASISASVLGMVHPPPLVLPGAGQTPLSLAASFAPAFCCSLFFKLVSGGV